MTSWLSSLKTGVVTRLGDSEMTGQNLSNPEWIKYMQVKQPEKHFYLVSGWSRGLGLRFRLLGFSEPQKPP
jgi:hypothetical protein